MEFDVISDEKMRTIYVCVSSPKDYPLTITVFEQDGDTHLNILDGDDGSRTDVVLGKAGYTTKL